jgi:hypothetical protein
MPPLILIEITKKSPDTSRRRLPREIQRANNLEFTKPRQRQSCTAAFDFGADGAAHEC